MTLSALRSARKSIRQQTMGLLVYKCLAVTSRYALEAPVDCVGSFFSAANADRVSLVASGGSKCA